MSLIMCEVLMAPSTPKAVLAARGAGAVGWVERAGGMVSGII
jgi:hypothetical protein